jgi:hypothetical protein
MSAKALPAFLIALIPLAPTVASAQTPPPEPPGTAAPETPAQQEAAPTPSAEAAGKESPPSKVEERQYPPHPRFSYEQTLPVKNPWFVRPPFEIKSGEWKLQLYGFAEVDLMNDSTRSFTDGANGAVLAHDGTQAGTLGRTQMTVRNSRIGIKVTAPDFGGVKATGVVEGDFFGYDPNPSGTATPAGAATPPSEAGFFNNPTWRLRHAYLKLETDVVDMLAGQSWPIFGWQNYFFASSVAFLGLPSEVFGRTPEVRLSHQFKSDAANFDIAVAALRPVQRDSEIPDGQAGLRLLFNHWKGISTPGNGGTAAYSGGLGLSGLIRRFRVDQFAAAPTPGVSSKDTGYAIAVNALIPVIPASDNTDRGNALTVVGEATMGTGDADQFTGMTAGATNRTAIPGGGTFSPDIDNGLVTYDTAGILHTIPWQTFLVDVQYYLPPSGRVFITANYTQANSNKMADFYPNAKNVYKAAQYADVSLFWDVAPAARLGIGGQYTTQTFCDNTTARNIRAETLALYFF